MNTSMRNGKEEDRLHHGKPKIQKLRKKGTCHTKVQRKSRTTTPARGGKTRNRSTPKKKQYFATPKQETGNEEEYDLKN